jgi:hypothetical protein
MITKDSLLLDEDLYFHRVPSNPAEIYIITTPHNQKFAIQAQNLFSPEGQRLLSGPSPIIKNPAVIWERPYSYFAVDGSPKFVSNAILVSRLFDREGVTYCKFEMSLDAWNIRNEHQYHHQKMVRRSGGIVGQLSAELVNGLPFCVG